LNAPNDACGCITAGAGQPTCVGLDIESVVVQRVVLPVQTELGVGIPLEVDGFGSRRGQFLVCIDDIRFVH
jgi:hypothetical protein